jgi:branched-chain amino acid transport system permease protein
MAQVLASGLAMGCVYALVGLSFVLIYNATHGLNFAHGEFVMLAGFVFWSAAETGAPLWAAALMALAAMAVFGFVFQRAVFYPLRDRPFLAFVIATIGFAIFARNLALLVWGPNPLKVESFFATGAVRMLGATLTPEHLFIIGATAVVLVAQYLLFYRTDLGRRLRATAQNPEMAQLLGIRQDRMIAITFILSAVLAGVAGVLVAPIFLLDTEMGAAVILKAFIGIVIGGFGSIPGAVAGGLLVGLMEILAAVYISSVYKDAIAFGVFILFLLVFPRGLFGGQAEDRV